MPVLLKRTKNRYWQCLKYFFLHAAPSATCSFADSNKIVETPIFAKTTGILLHPVHNEKLLLEGSCCPHETSIEM
eukprot:11723617-Karenia_brevis.AAC.1